MNQETCLLLLCNVPDLRLPDLVIRLFPFCITHGINTTFDNRHPVVQEHLHVVIQAHVKTQSYLILLGWSYALGLIQFEAASLLGWIRAEIKSSTSLF
jgi:hypothetical protein